MNKHPKVGTAKPKKHIKGWQGTSSASRTRKSPPRQTKKSGHMKTQSNPPAVGNRRFHDIKDIYGSAVRNLLTGR